MEEAGEDTDKEQCRGGRKPAGRGVLTVLTSERSSWMNTLEVATWRLSVILMGTFLASYTFTSTLPFTYNTVTEHALSRAMYSGGNS